MALIAEIFRFRMHIVTVRAVELILIVRRRMRIMGLDVLGLFNQSRYRVALRAGIDRRQFGFSHIHVLSMAHLAADAFGNMSVGSELCG